MSSYEIVKLGETGNREYLNQIRKRFNVNIRKGLYRHVPRGEIREEEVERWEEELKAGKTVGYVAVDGKDVVAWATLHIDDRCGLGEITVCKDLRLNYPGVGTELVRKLKEEAKEIGLPLLIRTHVENTPMQKIAEKLGFDLYTCVPGEWPHYEYVAKP